MGIRFGKLFGRGQETTDQRLEREFRANPTGYNGLSERNITEYAVNISGRLRDSEKGLPLSQLIAAYPPEKWAGRR